MSKALKTIAVLVLFIFIFTSCTILDDPGVLEEENNAVQLGEQLGTDNEYRKIDDIMDKGPVRGGVLNLFSTKPDTLNPVYTKNSYVQDFLGLVYEGLVKLNDKQEAVPQLSDKWTVSTDGLTWSFHIRTGVKWHDGSMLTAADVEFTVNSILNTKTDSQYKALLSGVVSFAAVDAENFKVVLDRPNSFLAELMCFPILPKHQFQEKVAADGGTAFKPVGTGPFRFESFEKDKNILFGAFRNWWYLGTVEKPAELLYLDKINIKLYDSSKDAINAFQTTDIDVSGIDAADIGKYYGRTDLIIRKFGSRNFEFLAFNLSGQVTGDIIVRNAVNKAINKKDIIDNLLNGCAVQAEVPVNPGSWLFEGLNSTESQPGSPETILEAGGWKKGEQYYYKNINGVRKELKLEILAANGNAQRSKIADKICEQLNTAGIPAIVVKLNWDEMMQRIETKKFDMAILGLRTSRTPDISYLYSNNPVPSYKALSSDIARNVSGYNNPEVNTYLQKILLENDRDVKKAYFINMKQIIDSELPYIGLFFLDDAVIYRKNVRGHMEPYTWDKYYDIAKWYVPDV
jgi:peptide/nickel transport system substrate-binding protein